MIQPQRLSTKEGFLTPATWTDLKDIAQSAMSQSQEIKSCIFHSCEVLRGVEIIETESRMGAAGGGGKCVFSTGAEFQFYKKGQAMGMDGGEGCR